MYFRFSGTKSGSPRWRWSSSARTLADNFSLRCGLRFLPLRSRPPPFSISRLPPVSPSGFTAIDFAGPVLAIQRALAEVRVVPFSRSNRWLLLSAPLLWALAVVDEVPHGLVGLDAYRVFGFPWVAGNLAVGLAVMAAAAWAGGRLCALVRGLALMRWLGDDLTGRKVAEASGFLDDIAAFEA